MNRYVALVLAIDGGKLTGEAVRTEIEAAPLACAQVERLEEAHGERASCVALTLTSPMVPKGLTGILREGARVHGWSVTVAPLEARA